MIRFIITVLIIGFMFIGCKNKHTSSSKNVLKEGSIEMKKSPCYGRCPVYEIKITNSGEVTYLGKKNVDKIGKYHKKLNDSELTTIFNAFNNSGIWDMKDEYDAHVSDVPTTYLNYSYDGKVKNIVDRFDAPEELKNLEKMVDVIAKSNEGWVRDEVQPEE